MDILQKLREKLKEEQWTRATIENYSTNDLTKLEKMVNDILAESKEKEALEICKEFVKHSPRSIIGLYILGFLSYETENLENADAVLQVVEIFKENKKLNIVENILKKILEYEDSIYALQMLVSIYSSKKEKEAEKIETLQKLVRLDTSNGNVAQKLAEYYEQLEKKQPKTQPEEDKKKEEKNSIRYYKLALRRYAKNKNNKVEEIWKKLTPEIYGEINFFLNIASSISEYNQDLSVSLLSNLLEILETEDKVDESIFVAKKILSLDSHNQKIRDKLVSLYELKYGGNSQFESCVQNSGLRNHKINIENAIKKFEKEILFEEGCYVYHKTWGIGKLEKIEGDDFNLVFDGKKKHRMSYSMALKSLTPLNPDHIWVLKKEEKIGDPNDSEEMEKILMSIMRSFPGKSLSIENFKEELVPSLVPAKEWNNWWNRAKNLLKEKPSVGTVKEGRPKYFLRDIDIRFEEELIDNFNQTRKFDEKLKIFEDFCKDSHSMEEFSDDFKEMVNFFKGVVESSRYDFNERFISRVLLQKLRKSDSWAIDEIPGEISDFMDLDKIMNVLSQNYRAEYKKDIIDMVEKYHPEKKMALHEILIHDKGQLADYIMEKLLSLMSSEELKHLVDLTLNNLFKSNPYITVWFLDYLIKDRKYEKYNIPLEEIYIETLYRLDTIGKLMSQKKLGWFNPPLYSAEAKKILSMINDILAKNDDFEKFVLNHKNKDYIVKIYHLIKSSTGMTSKKKTSLLKAISDKHPDIERIKTEEDFATHVKVDYFDPNIIWTTQKGLDAQKRQVDKLRQIKEKNLVDLEKAREKGDLRENAEYQAAREKDTNLNNQIMHLSQLIAKAKVLNLDNITGDIVTPGTTVTFKREGKSEKYSILGYWDTNEKKHIIAYNSPLARVILGAKKGEKRKVELGGETVQIEILDIQPIKK